MKERVDGKVYLIGAGPGSPDLITLRGLRALRKADLVILDKLLPPTFAADLGSKAETLWLGDDAVRRSQDEINELMIEAARAGRTVARLKGGDPFVFGRGGEALDALDAADVPWEAVPGLSSCIAAPSNAAFTLTDRARSQSFAAATARRAGGGVNDRFPSADSLVIFMGVEALDDVARRLIDSGRPSEAPAAVIERATQPWERRVSGPLGEIAHLARQGRAESPALLLVGAVARDAGTRRTLLYTGLDPTNFRTLGNLIHWPALHVVPDRAGYEAVPEVIAGLRSVRFSVVIFTSRIGVRSFFREIEKHRLDARSLGGTTVVAAGGGTAQVLREFGILPDIVPVTAGSRGILRFTQIRKDDELLVVQGTHAPGGLCEEIARRGANTTRLGLHRVEPNPDLGRPLPDHDVIYFTSPSGVRAWHATYGETGFGAEPWCIGDVTRQQLAEYGIDAKVVNPHVPD